MKYVVTHGEEELEIVVEPRTDGRYDVTVGDRSVVADFLATGGRSLHSLLLDETSYEVSVTQDEDQARVTARSREFEFRVESEQARNARLVDAASGASGPQTVKSVMPGRVLRVLVEVGQEVKAGEPLLILEAMKMENEIRSPGEGAVSEILIAEGATVGQGEALVKIG